MTSRLLACVILAGSAFGVVQPGGGSGQNWEQQVAATEPTVNLDFKGGTFLEYTEAVKKAVPSVNIVVSPSIQNLVMPAITLRGAALISAMEAAMRVTDDAITVQRLDGKDPVYAFSPTHQFKQQPTAGQAKPIEVYPIFQNMGKPQNILSAVENAIGLLPESTSVKISFHEPTQLLFVSGTPAHAAAVQGVLTALQMQSVERRDQMLRDSGSVAYEMLKVDSYDDMVAKIKHLQSLEASAASNELERAKKEAIAEAKIEVALRDAAEVRAKLKDVENMRDRVRDDLASRIEAMRAEAAAIKVEADGRVKQLHDLANQLDAERAANKEAKAMIENYRSMIESLKDELNKAKAK